MKAISNENKIGIIKASDLQTPMVVGMIKITIEDAEEIIAFTKMHEREEIPDEMWEVILKLQDLIEEET